MKNQEITFVNFHGNAIPTVLYNGEPHVSVREVCDQAGLDWSAQLQRIKRDEILNATVVMITTVAQDGKEREMVTLPLEMFNGWLFGIDANRVKPDLKATVLEYQRECFKVLYNHWHGKGVSPASPVYKRNQQHSLRLKLLQALEKADNKAVRESIYQSLSEVSNDLSLPLLPLNDFNWAGASVRAEAYSVCERFFNAVEALSIIDGVEINHTNHPEQLAVQLSEIIRLGKQYEIDVPKRMELIRYLPYSQTPQFIKRKIVCSGIRRNKKGAALAVRCWLFSRD